MLHWLFNTEGWVYRLTKGNGIDNGSGVTVGPSNRNHGLTKFTLTSRALGSVIQFFAGPFVDEVQDKVIDPYGPMIRMLEDLQSQRKVDLVVFAYDWRLSNACNATALAQTIRKKWWPNSSPEEFAALMPQSDHQITIIAHSMGGLIARYFIEASKADLSYIRRGSVRGEQLNGHRLVRRLITIGTPHLGAPESYLSYIGAVNPLKFQSGLLTFFKSQLYLPKLFDTAVKAEGVLASRGLELALPSLPQVADESPRAGDEAVQAFEVQALTHHMSSLVEMFPAWDFVNRPQTSDPGSQPSLIDLEDGAADIYRYYPHRATRPGRETVRREPLLFSGSPDRPWEMFRDFRRRLVPPECLDSWLKERDVRYHLLASLEHAVITGYGPPANPQVHIQQASGDGVVPGLSALMVPFTGARTEYIERTVLRSGDLHDMLCQSMAAMNTCRDLVDPATLAERKRRVREVVSISRFEDLKGLVHTILESAGFKGLPPRIIISVATIRFRSDAGVRPFATWFNNGLPTIPVSEYRRSNPWKTASWDVAYESGRQSIGRRRIVGIDAQEDRLWRPLGLGGVVFLPESKCLDTLEVLAWNLGDSSGTSLSAGVTNTTHAEVQLARWFVDRFGPWLDKQTRRARRPLLQAVDIANKGRGDSPCSMCQAELREIADWITDHTNLTTVGTLSWSRVYGEDVFSAASGPTYISDLDRTIEAGWNIDFDTSPPPTK